MHDFLIVGCIFVGEKEIFIFTLIRIRGIIMIMYDVLIIVL